MVNYLELNGNTYSDGSSDEGTGIKNLANGGHKKNLVPMMQDFLVEADTKIAATGASITATSTSSMVIGSSGSKSFTMEAGKGFAVNSRIRVAKDASNWMEGSITAFDQGTGATTFTADLSSGSGTFTSWTISIAGVRGATGATGATGASAFEWAPTTAGSSSAYTAAFSPVIASYTNGQPLIFIVHTNCAAGATLDAGPGAKPLFLAGAAVAANALVAGVAYIGVYDGTNIQVLGASSGGGETLVTPVVGAGSARTLNYSSGNVFDLTGTASTACTLTFSNLPASGTYARFRLIWRQDAVTGGATLVFPGSVKWLGRNPQTSAPTFTTSAGFVHEIEFITVDGGTTVYAVLVGGSTVNNPSANTGIYVAVGANGKVSSGTDGTVFTLQSTQFSGADILAAKWVNGRCHLVANVSGLTSANAKYTTNGTSFTAWGANNNSFTPYAIVVDSLNRILLPTSDASTVLGGSQNGGTTSTNSLTGPAGTKYFIASGGTQDFLITVGTSASSYKSTDGGATISSNGTHTGGGSGNINCIAYLNGNYILGYTSGDISYKHQPFLSV